MVFDHTITDVLDERFADLGGDSRVWIWQANTPLDNQQVTFIDNALRSFMGRWVSHNHALKASVGVFYDRFIVVMLDQAASTAASGCSIDSLTHEVVDVTKAAGVDVLDRTQFCFLQEGRIIQVHMSALVYADITPTSLVFDNLVKTKVELYQRWLKPVEESWHRRFL